MALTIPAYIQKSKIQDNNIRYLWDDGDAYEIYGDREDETSIDCFEPLSYRANLALTIASAEWVICRFNELSNDAIPHQYLEAAWAAVIDSSYLSSWEPDPDEWEGPIRGPIAQSMLIIKESVVAAEHEMSKELPPTYITNLAKHVLPDADVFSEWLDEVLKRLARLYPLDWEESWGEVVSREVFDVSNDFDPGDTEKLINNFLSSLDYKSNSFLNTPEEMMQLGYYDKPYIFNIENDRENRFEW